MPGELAVSSGAERGPYWRIERSGRRAAGRLGWQPMKALKLSIVGQNLLHAHHAEYGFPSTSREELQRGVYAKAAYRY